MEAHNHPDYERTFSRMTTMLERVVEALEQQQQLGLETDRRIDRYIEEARERDAETTDKLNALIDLMDRHLREHGKN